MINYLKSFLKNKKILILGMGREGISTFHFIKKYCNVSHLYTYDKNKLCKNADFYSSQDYTRLISKVDIIFKSPGIPFDEQLILIAEKIFSQVEIFLEFYRKQIIAVTGTKGKSTTVSLIHHLLKKMSISTVLGGNIGIPTWDLINEINENTWVVLELSAHQLQKIQKSSKVAILLNIFPEHLDYYKDMHEYKLAKDQIWKKQSSTDFIIYPKVEFGDFKATSNAIPFNITYTNNGFNLSYDDVSEFTISKDNIQILGKHNYYNISAALLAVKLATGVEISHIIQYLNSFKGLPHRLEKIASINNLDIYNDSISTVPETAIAALETFRDATIEFIILGGYDRSTEIIFDNLVEKIIEMNVNNVILLPDTGRRISSLLKLKKQNSSFKINVYEVNSIKQAVKIIFSVNSNPGIVLFSPAASSYNMFNNFQERGEYFKQCVLEYKKN